MQTKRVTFRHVWLPYLLCLPQLAVTLIFFIWPAAEAIVESFYRTNAFGTSMRFVWFENFTRLFHDPSYYASMRVSVIFALSTTVLAMSLTHDHLKSIGLTKLRGRLLLMNSLKSLATE